MKSKSYKDLIVWQKSIQFVIEIYSLTDQFPKSEMFGLSSQIKRAAVSIPSNIAEGGKRGTKKDFRKFLLNSFGSGAEIETQIEISKRLPFRENLDFSKVDSLLDEIMRMLYKTIKSLEEPKNCNLETNS